MKQIIILFVVALVAIAAWKIGTALSSDAVSMAVGVLFGVLAGVPSAILAARMKDEAGRQLKDEAQSELGRRMKDEEEQADAMWRSSSFHPSSFKRRLAGNRPANQSTN